MPLSGELTDLSLAELIEFFCNQRKTGCLEVVYEHGDGHFYLQAGSLVHATIGVLRGVEAVHYALTLSNASFTFNSGVKAPEQTVDQAWTSVVLEGLRRLDEGVIPQNPFPDPNGNKPKQVDAAVAIEKSEEVDSLFAPDEEPLKIPSPRIPQAVPFGTLLSESESPFSYGPQKLAVIFAAVILVVAVIAVPWGWYARSKAAKLAAETQAASTEQEPPQTESSEPMSSPTASPANGSKEISVHVIYDEYGRVTDAFGGDAEALRIARQRRFPAGKAGSATIIVPSN